MASLRSNFRTLGLALIAMALCVSSSSRFNVFARNKLRAGVEAKYDKLEEWAKKSIPKDEKGQLDRLHRIKLSSDLERLGGIVDRFLEKQRLVKEILPDLEYLYTKSELRKHRYTEDNLMTFSSDKLRKLHKNHGTRFAAIEYIVSLGGCEIDEEMLTKEEDFEQVDTKTIVSIYYKKKAQDKQDTKVRKLNRRLTLLAVWTPESKAAVVEFIKTERNKVQLRSIFPKGEEGEGPDQYWESACSAQCTLERMCKHLKMATSLENHKQIVSLTEAFNKTSPSLEDKYQQFAQEWKDKTTLLKKANKEFGRWFPKEPVNNKFIITSYILDQLLKQETRNKILKIASELGLSWKDSEYFSESPIEKVALEEDESNINKRTTFYRKLEALFQTGENLADEEEEQTPMSLAQTLEQCEKIGGPGHSGSCQIAPEQGEFPDLKVDE